MHFDWLTIVGPLLGLAATAIGGWIAHKLGGAADHAAALARAQLLSHIAADAAAIVVGLFPDDAWALLLQKTVKAIAAAAGLPTTDAAAIERAAAGALAKLGRSPTPAP